MADTNPLSFSICVPVRFNCSGVGCERRVEIPELPMMLSAPTAPPTLSSRGIQQRLPAGWVVGALRVVGGNLVLPGQAAPSNVAPMPVLLCPDCAAARS